MKINIRNFCLKTSLLIFMLSAFAAKHHKSQRGAHRGSRNTREFSRTISRESGVDRRRTFCDFSKYPWIMWTLCIIISPLNVALREEIHQIVIFCFFCCKTLSMHNAQIGAGADEGTQVCEALFITCPYPTHPHSWYVSPPRRMLIYLCTQKHSCDITMVYNFTRSV